MTDTLELGIPGLRLTPGDHVCAFYRSVEERDAILMPFLREGLRAGDKCICIVDSSDPEVVSGMVCESVGGHQFVSDEQLVVLSSLDVYLRGDRFSTEEMLHFWEKSIGSALGDGGFSFARSVGEMTWALRDAPGVDELIGYESKLNRFLPRFPQVIMCLYDLARFGGEVLVDLLATHPRLLIGGLVVDNPYYIDPDDFLAGR